MFLDNPVRCAKYDPSTGKVYGLLSSPGFWHFAAIDVETGKMKRLTLLPGLRKIPSGSAAMDGTTRRYFFIGKAGENNYVHVLNLDTGALINRYELKNDFVFIEYHHRTYKLYGLSKSKGIYRELAQTYAAVYKGKKRLHLGMCYSVIIDNGEIDIFSN